MLIIQGLEAESRPQLYSDFQSHGLQESLSQSTHLKVTSSRLEIPSQRPFQEYPSTVEHSELNGEAPLPLSCSENSASQEPKDTARKLWLCSAAASGCCLLQQPPGFTSLALVPGFAESPTVSSPRLACPFSCLAGGQRQLPSPQDIRDQEDAHTEKTVLHDQARKSRCPSCIPGPRKE